MTVTLRDANGHRADRRWIESVYRDYLDDLAPDATGVFPSLNEIGFCEPDQLAQWFADESASVLTLLSQQQPVGFAMVAMARGGLAAGTVSRPYRMTEFFIARPYRRRGMGRQAARLLLDRFAGYWEITQAQNNAPAVQFWRRIITQYTAGNYQERSARGEVMQTFRSGAAGKLSAPS